MKNGTRNLFIGLGIVAGAIITSRIIGGKTRDKIKRILSQKRFDKKSDVSGSDSNYI